tara:strand:- start:543 stop:779 length:237 start_codon:yes stop_codon:yes gene_type:complete
MSPLNAYLDHLNKRQAFFNAKPYTLPDDAERVLQAVECDLSPENLHADGERSRSDVKALRDFLARVKEEIDDVLQATA